jgi:hypothetical protein
MKQFKAKIDTEKPPKIEVGEIDGFYVATLFGGDVEEKVDGYSIREMDYLIDCLMEARNYMTEKREVNANV